MMYKLSQFNMFCETEGDCYIFNSFTGIDSVSRIPNLYRKDFVDKLFDENQYSQNQIESLLSKGFIVESSENEIDKIKYLSNSMLNGRVMNLTILVTRGCNFRCSYCYESFENIHMTTDVCDKIIKYVSKNISGYSGLHVSWFGGEPLVGIDAIEYLSNAFLKICNTARKTFTASITTNGYLLDIDCFKRLLKYHTIRYQVTIDGMKDIHDSQRVLCNGKGTFDTIVNNIKSIKSEVKSGRFTFVVRTNFSKKSVCQIPEYIEYLERLFEDDNRFSLFVRSVSYLGGGEEIFSNNSDNITDFRDRKNIFRIVGDSVKTLPLEANYDMMCFGQCACYAAFNNHIIIDVDATLRKCTCNLDDNKNNNVGYIDNSGKAIINYTQMNRWISGFTQNKECLECPFVPVCLQKNCPANSVYNQDNGCPYEKLEFDSLINAYVRTHIIKDIFEP